ncbi:MULTISPECIES: autotransporter outer membrane beta-barrel domain-containing protein [unclassified Snodgrassella]|uniref:autotransporter outer membrane beta-barrel domain-containing protein n=2 Tax=Snodgrassella TaxID=1193515 RepID=UPI0018DB383C|nr:MULTISPECIES: autotransporter outer membrane beta-barrel domain-containing protein [unclassified Snodgrassella]MBI0097372.1 autotransporter outer membrane beta-barrel domain-containing protein [Snodgrassella sp. W8134]MBI0100895.1 autotransporter outer membrane beta-barrel domain-containing protein [Snodgrassella sp. W8135]
MNNIYKSKWSEATQTWVACSELVRGKTKNNCVKIAATIALALTSLGSYAADTPCDINAGNSVVASGTTCSLPDGTKYTEISGSGATLDGGSIEAIGSAGSKTKKTIGLDGQSELHATNVITTSRVSKPNNNALAITGNSTVRIDNDLTATSKGSAADIISNSDRSELSVGHNITIKDDNSAGFYTGIKNHDNSKILAKNGKIEITSENDNNGRSIENDNSIIEAGSISITQGSKNYAIYQTATEDNEENSYIKITNDLTINSGSIPEGNSTVTIEGGSIEVGGKTNITTHVDTSEDIEDPKKISAISITNGKYTAKGGANINIKDNDEGNFKDAAGVIIGNKGTFENSGTLTVNDGANTVIATDLESGEEATFTNNAGGTTTSRHADTIVHNSSGILTVNNDGKLISESDKDSVLKNNKNGEIVVNNNNASSVINGNITNTKDGNITLDNKGTVNSTITNQNTGAIKITNDNTLVGSITNTGYKVNKNDPDNIWIDNNKNLNGNIDNDGNGSIVVKNNTASSVINGNITNTKDGNITLDNKGTFDGYIKNKGTGGISLNNKNTVSGYIENNGTGGISLTNNGTINGSITNTGSKVNKNDPDNIWIDNNKNLNSTIENRDGSIVVNNNEEGSSFTGDIYNNTGEITVNNNAKTSTIKGDITNINGRVNIENSGEANYSKITNSGGHLNIDNMHEGDFQGNIDNDATGTGFINITNSGNTFNGTITNQNTGTISITNDKTFNSTITNTGDKGTGDYNIKITNNKELTSSIENKGTGSIYIGNTKDTGRITGNITNNNTGTIILNNDGKIASDILNGAAGAINITNNGTLDGSITNTGDITNTGAANITITNQDEAVLNSNINNDGSGSIIFTNNGDVDANVVNNNPSVRINDTSLRQIQNTGNGKITIINNKTLNRPISNTSGGIIDITNNSSMETDITNNTESSEGGITFKNKQEFKGKLINANSGSISATNTGTFTGVTTNSGSGILDLDNQGIWNNTGNSVLTKLENKTGTIIFPQVSEVNAGDKDQYHTITVNGNYTGGGLMRVNTVWNKDGTSYSDRVDIHGDVDGAATTVQTLNGIYGDVTLKEIPIHSAVVVHVAGKSSGNDFTGSAPTTNAGEAQLKKIDTTSGTDYAWTLTAQNKTPEPTNPGVSGPTDPNVSGPTAPDKPILPAPPITEVPIYAEPVSGYVQMPTADMELGFTTIGTLHERRGENQTYNITGSNNTALGGDQQQTWGRVLVKHLDKDGKKRLDTAGNQSVLQIGHDFILDENEKTGTRRHIGGYVAYGHNENDFRDEYRAKNGYIVDDHYTGKGRTDAVSVGGYGTFYGNNGGYVDLVGQVTYLRNKYNARSNESVHQNGWGAALSAETGKSFIVYGNNWFVEPQAQLVYQYLSLDDFNDRIRHVDQHDPSALRGRVGMRFGYNGDTRDNLPSSSFYGIANIWHDFVNPKSVDIGRDSLKEEYAKTWGELGLGIQLPITRQSDFYSDIRYEKNFGSDKRKGFKGTMGYKYTWL